MPPGASKHPPPPPPASRFNLYDVTSATQAAAEIFERNKAISKPANTIRYRGPRFYHYRESTYVFYLASTRLETWRFPDNRRINPNRRYRSRSPLLAEIPHTASLVSPLRPISISRATSSSRNLFNLYSSFLYLPLLTSFARHFLVYLVHSILSSISITMKFYNVYFRELSHFLLIYNSYWNFFQKSEAITTADGKIFWKITKRKNDICIYIIWKERNNSFRKINNNLPNLDYHWGKPLWIYSFRRVRSVSRQNDRFFREQWFIQRAIIARRPSFSPVLLAKSAERLTRPFATKRGARGESTGRG